MSLLATSYRYEILNSDGKQSNYRIEYEKARVKADEDYASRLQEAQLNFKVNEVSKWFESQEETSERRRIKRELLGIKDEIHRGSQALVMVRREKLKRLLAMENQIYERELSDLGKAFYQERL